MPRRAVPQWVVLAAAIAGLRFALRWFSWALQQRLNPVLAKPPYEVPGETARFHAGLTVADLHSDALMWNTDLLKWNRIGQVDIPRLVAGNIALQVFSVVTKVPVPEQDATFGNRFDLVTLLAMIELWPLSAWFNLTRRALYQAHKLKRVEERSQGQLTIVRSGKDLVDFLSRREANANVIAGLLSLEGAHAFRGNLSSIDVLHDAGFRIAGLTHLSDNAVGGAGTGAQRYGLTDYGREVVRKLDQKGMIIDLAHASPSLITDVLDLSVGPILVTHTGVKGVCPSPRNLSDREIRDIAGRGGLIGIGYDSLFTGEPGIIPIIHSIEYVARLVGVEHVALGSDYDGVIKAPFDASGLPLITQGLKEENFSADEIQKIMGGNVMRFLTQNLP